MNAQSLSVNEYVALTAMRATVKAMNRICASNESFRSPFVRRLVTSAVNVLRECVAEIEGYDPQMAERERIADYLAEPEVERVAQSDARRQMTVPVASPAIVVPVEETPAETKKRRPHHWRNGKPAHYTIVRTCPHCGNSGRGPVMFRNHFDRCKQRKQEKSA